MSVKCSLVRRLMRCAYPLNLGCRDGKESNVPSGGRLPYAITYRGCVAEKVREKAWKVLEETCEVREEAHRHERYENRP